MVFLGFFSFDLLHTSSARFTPTVSAPLGHTLGFHRDCALSQSRSMFDSPLLV